MAKHDKTGHRTMGAISEKQAIAIRELVAGKRDEEAAKAAGVSRQTINGWKHNDLRFREELKFQQAVIFGELNTSLPPLISSALACLQKAIQNGDVKACCYLLDHLNFGDILKNFDYLWSRPSTLEEMIERTASYEAYDKIKKIEADPLNWDFSNNSLKREEYHKQALAKLERQYGLENKEEERA